MVLLKVKGYNFRGSNCHFPFLLPLSVGVNSQRNEFASLGATSLSIQHILEGLCHPVTVLIRL